VGSATWDRLTISYKTHIAYTFTHSRLVNTSGPGVRGHVPARGRARESWTQRARRLCLQAPPRRALAPKPPSRASSPEDVRYTVERFLTLKGNANAYMLRSVDKVEALDRYTVKFTLKEPFAWFLDMLANPWPSRSSPREAVESSATSSPRKR